MTGFKDGTGRLAVGGRADFVAVDATGKLVGSVVGGIAA
jgi:cytosine/adenosine deaminase-related metal-dependent hydrolase